MLASHQQPPLSPAGPEKNKIKLNIIKVSKLYCFSLISIFLKEYIVYMETDFDPLCTKRKNLVMIILGLFLSLAAMAVKCVNS